jgi:hypothetical protein
MTDLLKQMLFLLTIEMYKLWHKGTTCVISMKTLMSELGWTVKIAICSALLKCTVTEFRTWADLTVFSLYTKSEL